MDLLIEAGHALETAGAACESSEDAARFFALAERVRHYLEVSRPTTTLGMPRIVANDPDLISRGLTSQSGMQRRDEFNKSHVRILTD